MGVDAAWNQPRRGFRVLEVACGAFFVLFLSSPPHPRPFSPEGAKREMVEGIACGAGGKLKTSIWVGGTGRSRVAAHERWGGGMGVPVRRWFGMMHRHEMLFFCCGGVVGHAC